jgi:nucleotide-binding universal stress UspA family protein
MVAIGLGEEAGDVSETLRGAVERVLEVTPGARLACVNVLRTNRIALNSPLDTDGRNIHMMRLLELREWARPLRPLSDQITFHVLEAPDAASALIDYARLNHADQIVIAAGANSAVRRRLGSVASRVVAEAPCTVTVVRDRNEKDEGPADAGKAE